MYIYIYIYILSFLILVQFVDVYVMMNKKKIIKRFSSRKFIPLYDYYFPIKKMKVKERERDMENSWITEIV